MKLKKAIEIVEIIKASIPPYISNAGEALDTVIKATVDAEPVRHGHWIKEKYERPICSVCGNKGFLSIIDSITGDFPYCAWCGAKMDGGKTE